MKSALEEVEEIVAGWRAEQSRTSKSFAALEEKYRHELDSLQERIRASRSAIVAAQAAEAARKNSEKRKVERAYEIKLHEAEQTRRKALKDIADRRDQLGRFRGQLPDSVVAVENGYGFGKQDLFSASDYEELISVARDASLKTSIKRFLGNGSLSPSQAHGRVLAMLTHDEAILASMEHAAKNQFPGDELKQECAAEMRKIDSAPAEAGALRIDNDVYEAERERLRRNYEKAKLRIQASDSTKKYADVVGRCRALCLDRSTELGCAPGNLTSDYVSPSSVSDTMFDYWAVVDVDGQKIVVPHAFCMEQPRNYLIEASKAGKEEALRAVRSMAAFQLKQMPHGMLKIYWFDARTMGRSLGVLSELASPVSSEGKAPIVVAASLTELSRMCGELEEEMGRRSLKIASSGSVWQYNRMYTDDQVPNVLVVAIDAGGKHFDKEKMGTLSTLAANGTALGVQVIATTETELNRTNKEDGLEALASECAVIRAGDNGLVAVEGGEARQLMFAGENWIPAHLIDPYKRFEQEGHLRKRAPLSFDVSIDEKGLRIPIGWDRSGAEIALDFSDYAHAFLAGISGSGKSVFLHNVITKACERYSPEDLQICLVDYKKSEFGIYQDDRFCFPNIIFIGLDNTRSFVDAFMEYLIELFNERQKLINDERSRDIRGYNRTHADKLPQLLVVMDEFHRQSALTERAGESARNLEFLLRESRSYGIHFLIADQEIGNLMGLSEPARKQLGGRIQLNWAESSELANMFEVTSYDLGVNSLNRGQAIIKSTGELKLCEWPYVSEDDIAAAKEKASSKWKRVEPLLVQDSSEAQEADIAQLPATSDGAYAIGTTANFLNPYIGLSLSRRRRENVFILNKSSDMSARLACAIAASHVRRRGAGRIVLLSPKDELVYGENERYWAKLKGSCTVKEYFDASGACSYLDDGAHDGDFVIFLGLDALTEEMEDAGDKVEERGGANFHEGSVASINNRLEMLLRMESGDLGEEPVVNVGLTGAAYDARSALLSLVRSGGSRDIHACVISDTVPNLYAVFGPDSARDDLKELFPFRITPSCEYGEAAALGVMEAGFGESGGLAEEVYMVTKSGAVEVFSPFRFEI